METQELKLGFMSFEDLANWVGITYDTFRKKAKKTLIMDSLCFYCNYTIEKGGVNIKDIFVKEYDNTFSEDVRFFFTILFEQPESSKYNKFAYVGSLTSLAAQYIDEYNETVKIARGLKPIGVTRLTERLGEVCSILFSETRYSSKEQGIRSAFNEVEGGPYGWKQGQLLIREKDGISLRELTNEEWRIFFNMFAETDEMKDVVGSQAFTAALVDYCDGVERSAESIGNFVKDYMKYLKKVKSGFGRIIKKYRLATGKTLIRGTVWVLRIARGKEVKLLVDIEDDDEDIKEVCG